LKDLSNVQTECRNARWTIFLKAAVVTYQTANVLSIYYYLLDWFYWVSKSGATTHTHTHTLRT